MARKSIQSLKGRQDRSQALLEPASRRSWAAVGVDTSLTAVSACAVGYDATTDKFAGPSWAEIRWMPEDSYFTRLKEASAGHELILDVIHELWVVELDRVVIAVEEPVPYGIFKKAQSEWIKQQCEIAGAFKGSIAKWGFPNIYEINNQQWKKTLRDEGVVIRKGAEGKWDVKQWAIQAFGMPDLPDLISRKGAKVPRPEGSKAKGIQPLDVYDAAACAAWAQDLVTSGRSVIDV